MVELVMDVKAVRLHHLREIIDTDFHGNAGACADALGIKRPQLSRWITPNDMVRQGISEESARTIELKLGKPAGTMDRAPNGSAMMADETTICAEFAWTWQNCTEEGRDFLRNTIRLAAKSFLANGNARTDEPDLFVVQPQHQSDKR